ncbi:acyl-CoA-binding domain-containing protein 5 [Vombatus ursinus]|uniref:Acyl-CoA-binding domain-containing protein 5 n=1 Tax=Vombatus ursinus TaxID=29139 RepID=A0A4X2M6M4_VOMUR|nr:acyl-CoA-binding domain-containing protein 5 [Vombatus ursinus]XP_027697312.1 acyl-CoA-binding domain-containing protein 5 [Vombatus ursinus]XP_027697314.1 acyl-CoA-binding domain-containing protein 5 [Vombatus ursinus]
MADTRSVHETRFEAAVKVIQSLPKNGSFQPTNEMMLKFYSFYKQATEGPCNISRPGFWDPIGRYKWDAWSSLGDMTKEEAMIAYVEEMKKILETMPMTEKVEELLHVIGPFYEIVEDKKSNRSSDLTSDLGNVLSSTPKVKTVNGKAESSDSGAESEGEETQEEVKETKKSKKVMPEPADDKDLEIVFTSGYDKDSVLLDTPNDIHASSSLNGSSTEEVKNGDQNLKQTGQTPVSIHQGTCDDHVEDISGIQHLTSDSDSEVYCDSMEQFGQEESSEIFSSSKGPVRYSSHYLGGDHSQLLENSGLPEEVCIASGNLRVGEMQTIAIEGKGEVKCGGEDGRPSSGAPQREKCGGEKEEFSGMRRGRGHRMQHLGDGLHSGHMGSGGDGERRGSDRGCRGSLNEQIAVALTRLQEDMKNILQRLHTLETLAASQAKSSALQTDNRPPLRPSWWPFEMSPSALTFAIVWPFIAQWLVHLYYQRRRRKLN